VASESRGRAVHSQKVLPRIWFLVAAGAVAAGLETTACRGHDGQVVRNLIAEFPAAFKRPSDDQFTIQDLNLRGGRKASIVVRGSTRLTYHVTVPKGGAFRVAVALVDPVRSGGQEAGLLFTIGISDGHTYRGRKSALIKASGEWVDCTVDLTEFELMTVDLILNTREWPEPFLGAGRPTGAWGSPVIEDR
jgi:hypothetical protein